MIWPQSAPCLVFANCIELLHLRLQRIWSIWFWYWPSSDVHRLLCCWKKMFAMTSVFSWQNSVSLCPSSFCTPRPNLPVMPSISWLPTFAVQSPMKKRTFFFFFLVLFLEGLVGLHRTIQLQLLQISGWGRDLDYLNGLPWKWTEIILLILRLHPNTAFQTLL